MNPQAKDRNHNVNNIFQYLKENITIEEAAIKLGLQFETSGNELKCSCPTGHPSQSGRSFTIFTSTDSFHCFNCGISGSVIDLVCITRSCNLKDAAFWLIQNFSLEHHIDPEVLQGFRSPTLKMQTEISRSVMHQLYSEVFSWGQKKLYLEEGKEVLEYLTASRKYEVEKLKRTDFFYFPPMDEIKEHLNDVFPELKEQIQKLPLQGSLGDRIRLAFPYRNRMGMITGIIKRVPDSKGVQKFNKDGIPALNKDGGEIYERYDSTYRTVKEDLFGLDKIGKTDNLLVVEGYPDAIYLPALGYKDVVALGQGLFSQRHIDGLVSKKIKNVILALDNDKVGPKNTLRAIDILLRSTDINVFVLEQTKMNPHKDPDEFVRANGLEAFKSLMSEAEEGELWKLKKITGRADFKTPLGKRSAYQDALAFAVLIRNEAVRTDYFLQMATSFDKKKADIVADFKKVKSARSVQLYKDERSRFSERLHNKYLPFIEKATSTYAYYDKVEDEVHLGMGTDILEQILLSNGQRMPEIFPVLKAVYNPLEDRKFVFEKDLFNLFTPSVYMKMKRNDRKISLLNECPSISRLLGNLIPKADERERFINWLSGILQMRQKQLTAWVFKGAQGTGKNLLREQVLQPLFGQRQVIQVEDQMLESEFNGYLKNVMLIAFNEVANKDNNSRNGVKSKIKAIITDKEIWINEKQIKPFPIENFVNCIFFSNEGVPILIEEGDRRFNVVNTGTPLRELQWFRADPEAFIASLAEEVPIFAQYLMNYDYDAVKAKTVFMNDEKAALIRVGMNRYQEFAMHLKEGDFEWFNESQTPRHENPFNMERTITVDDINGKILKDLALELFNRIYSKNQETKTSLTLRLELYGIKAERLLNKDGIRRQYYVWE